MHSVSVIIDHSLIHYTLLSLIENTSNLLIYSRFHAKSGVQGMM